MNEFELKFFIPEVKMNSLKFMTFIMLTPIWVTSVIGCSCEEERILHKNNDPGERIKEREALMSRLLGFPEPCVSEI